MKHWRRNLYAICAAQLLTLIGFSSYLSFIPYYLQTFTGLGDTEAMNWTAGFQTAGMLAMMIAAPIWGGLADRYSVSLWLWNGMPNDGRAMSGWLFSRGHDHGLGTHGDHLGIGGTSGHAGRLVFLHGDDPGTAVAGKSEIPRWQWRHVVLVRDAETVRVYLNGEVEIETKAAAGFPADLEQCFFGGRSDNDSNWEGRLDEIAVFDRALTADEVARLAVK